MRYQDTKSNQTTSKVSPRSTRFLAVSRSPLTLQSTLISAFIVPCSLSPASPQFTSQHCLTASKLGVTLLPCAFSSFFSSPVELSRNQNVLNPKRVLPVPPLVEIILPALHCIVASRCASCRLTLLGQGTEIRLFTSRSCSESSRMLSGARTAARDPISEGGVLE